MSRRTIAHAERQVQDVGNQNGTRKWTIAVHTPQRKGSVGNGTRYVMVPRGEDPTKVDGKVCRSHRESRARRQAKFMYGTVLYRERGGQLERVSDA